MCDKFFYTEALFYGTSYFNANFCLEMHMEHNSCHKGKAWSIL